MQEGNRIRAGRYVVAIREILAELGHATNNDILERLREDYPDISATTVHRITARLVDNGILRLAPNGLTAEMRFDANNRPHDHFKCELCGALRDADFGDEIRPYIERSIGAGCRISGNLTVSGVCGCCCRREDGRRRE